MVALVLTIAKPILYIDYSYICIIYTVPRRGLGYAIYGHCRIYTIGKGRPAAGSIATVFIYSSKVMATEF